MTDPLNLRGPDGKTPLEEARDSTVALGYAMLAALVVVLVTAGLLAWHLVR
jgi:hypothetical protein